jgi:hypothetical protein
VTTPRSGRIVLGVAAFLATLSACSSGDTSPGETLAIAPSAPELLPGGSVQFGLDAAPGEPVAWAVLEPGGGAIDPTGFYTAPAAEGTYTVTASLSSRAVTQRTEVRVRRIVRVDVSPVAATVAAGESLALAATVSGPVKTVDWSVVEGPGGGSVTADGIYTAPATAGVYTVVATSTADATKSGRATMTVTEAPVSPPPVSVAIVVSPQTASVAAGGTVQLTATVTGAADAGATWSVAEAGGGTVSATGLYKAPGTAGAYHVVAKSAADPSKSATATVTVEPPPPPPPPSGMGTGAQYRPSYVTWVTGGGAMPSWTTNVVTAVCAGDGIADDTGCLQAAANAARDQGKALVIPYKPAFYRITGPVTIFGSVGGVGGMPTIRQTSTSGSATGVVLTLARGMTGWVHNLHLLGTFGGSATGEWAHDIDVGSVSGVTIRGNLLENAMGDAIGTDASKWDGGLTSSNVLVDGNTIVNPRRCGVAFIYNQRSWVVTNNVFDKQVNYVSAIDFEPEGGTMVDIEVAYNRFVMNDRTPGQYGSDGRAASAWQNSWTPSPGGNLYLHHNYGTFGVGWWMGSSSYKGGMGDWYNVVQSLNVEGATVPQ